MKAKRFLRFLPVITYKKKRVSVFLCSLKMGCQEHLVLLNLCKWATFTVSQKLSEYDPHYKNPFAFYTSSLLHSV